MKSKKKPLAKIDENTEIARTTIRDKSINYQFKLLTICPLPARSPKITIIESGVEYNNMEKPTWEKWVGNYKVKIIADPAYGFPRGRDVLVVLFLIKEALAQNNDGIIQLKTLDKFNDTFGITKGGRDYKKIIKMFKRIYYSTWYFENHSNGEASGAVRMIDQWNVFFDDKKGTNPLFDSFIKLSSKFWKYVNAHPIPYDLEIVKKVQNSPHALALYLFLSWRTYVNFNHEKEEVFIPFFGPNGLRNQFSSELSRKQDFKRNFFKWLDTVKEHWPECPVSTKVVEASLSKYKKEKIKDGIFIHATSMEQLSVKPHFPKLLREAEEERNENSKFFASRVTKVCVKCAKPAVFRFQAGTYHWDGIKDPDYYKCTICGHRVEARKDKE